MSTVYFRTFEEEDFEKIYIWRNDDKLNCLSVGLNKRMSREECRKWVLTRRDSSPYEVWWAICSNETGELIGYTYLSSIHFINRSAEFGGILIGDAAFQDGFAWIETYLFVMDYTFKRLNLNRLEGYYISEHNLTHSMCKATFFKVEGVRKEAIYKNGKYHDRIDIAILAKDYYHHLQENEYDIKSIMRRVVKIGKQKS